MPRIDLQISKPALLLNRIAQRYTTLSRILMEYVDNSLDDAERYFNRETGIYSKNVKIQIGISHNPHCVVITDNCNGMDKKQMTRLIQNVGESQKHSKFTNGQFGFGVHAFRAAAKSLTIWSKTGGGDTYELHIDRESAVFNSPKVSEAFQIKHVGGTQVVLRDLDKSWIENLSVKAICEEIQFHFDGLLRRKNLRVLVRDSKGKVTECRPFSYRGIVGQRFSKKVRVNGKQIRAALWVSETPIPNQHTYFTSNGRRINEVHEVKSFMRYSRARYNAWNHPHVAGYIEVSDVVEPVITRDEFRRNDDRKALYEAIVKSIEPDLLKLVEEVNSMRRTLEMGRLGSILSKCFNSAVRKDNHRLEGAASYVEQVMKDPNGRVGKRKLPNEWTEEGQVEGEAENQQEENGENDANPAENPENPPSNPTDPSEPPKKRQKRESKLTKLKKVQGQFSMVFVNELNDPEGNPQRGALIGDDMFINAKHPDFTERMQVSAHGSKLMITQRLNSYIAAVSANSYKKAVTERSKEGLKAYAEDTYQLFSELTDLEMSLERQLRKYLPAIQSEVGRN